MKRLLLDTSAYSGLLRGYEEIYERIRHADTVYLTNPYLGLGIRVR